MVNGTHCRTGPGKPEIWGLTALFGALYFVQGIAEPTEGLIAQPVRSLLDQWKYSRAQIGAFAFAIALPWTLKPVFGLLSDFVPLAGQRRKSYLLLASSAASVCLFLLFFSTPGSGSIRWLLAWLIIPTAAIAFSDVVIDALMVEKGQPLGLTGRFQSVQWTSHYAAMILTGWLGGWLSQHQLQNWGFLICGAALLPTVAMVYFFVSEPPFEATGMTWRDEMKSLRSAVSVRMFAAVAFLFLWNFNPFSTAVLQSYMTNELGWTEEFYGQTLSIQAISSMVACAAYGFYCRRVSMKRLVHLSILLGIVSTIGYWFMFNHGSAVVVSAAVGFTYVTANMIQMDLAARICPPGVSASVFATLMAVTNFGLSLSYAVGGYLYDWGSARWDPHVSFRVLVGIGAITTAACWLFVPLLFRGTDLRSVGTSIE